MEKTQSKTEKVAMVGGQAELSIFLVPSTQQYEKKRKGLFQDVSMSSPIIVGMEKKSSSWHSCNICGKTHPGPCRFGQDVCYRCGQSRYYLKDYP